MLKSTLLFLSLTASSTLLAKSVFHCQIPSKKDYMVVVNNTESCTSGTVYERHTDYAGTTYYKVLPGFVDVTPMESALGYYLTLVPQSPEIDWSQQTSCSVFVGKKLHFQLGSEGGLSILSRSSQFAINPAVPDCQVPASMEAPQGLLCQEF